MDKKFCITENWVKIRQSTRHFKEVNHFISIKNGFPVGFHHEITPGLVFNGQENSLRKRVINIIIL